MSEVYYRLTSDEQPAAAYLADRIVAHLKRDERVLWLISGGSAIKVAVQASNKLADAGVALDKLAVSLVDERYGAVGHPDSNWLQLEQAGFSLPGAVLTPVLSGQSLEQATKDFEAYLERELRDADYRMGLFGIGTDGHTAGILPDSTAVGAEGLTCGYDGGEYRRITMTERAIAKLDEAVLYAVGADKHPALETLAQDVPVKTQPAQTLKTVPKLTIFNDYKGDAA